MCIAKLIEVHDIEGRIAALEAVLADRDPAALTDAARRPQLRH